MFNLVVVFNVAKKNIIYLSPCYKCTRLIDWCLTSTLAIFQLYCSENSCHYILITML